MKPKTTDAGWDAFITDFDELVPAESASSSPSPSERYTPPKDPYPYYNYKLFQRDYSRKPEKVKWWEWLIAGCYLLIKFSPVILVAFLLIYGIIHN